MIDIDDIKKRHLDPERNRGRTYYEGHIEVDLAALCDEVERLRAEADEMRRWAEEAAHAENLNAQDAQKERAAVVAWLRAECGSPGHEDRFCAYCNVRRNIAADIERGEHRREEGA